MNQNDSRTLVASHSQLHGVDILTLRNGLKVIVKEDHRTPVAICQVWVRVGSNRELDNLRGWSHGIEHMIFKGTQRRAESDFAREVADAGGTTNAGTGYETTNYHVLVPQENLPRAFDILSDALFNAEFDAASLDAERQVLVHENHMYDDIPFGFGITWRWGMELAYQRSPYQYPIGGRDTELLDVPRDEILKFYRSAYHPSNMTVVVVGDVSRETVLPQLTQYFAVEQPAPELDLSPPPTEPIQTGLRCRLETGDLQKAYAKLLFPTLGENDPQRPVLSVVRRILSEGRSCRLYRIVQEEKQLVSNVIMMTETGPREGVMIIDLETDPERLLPAVEAVASVLEELREQPPSADELQRAKIRVERAFLFNSETVQGQSSTLGYYDSLDDLAGAFEYPSRVNQVTAEDVTRFCRQYFRRSNLNAMFYVPQNAELPGELADPAALDTLMAPVLGDLDFTSAETVAPHASLTAPLPTPDSPTFELAHLLSGLPVYIRVDRTLPVFTLGIYAPGGVCLETWDRAGLAALTQNVQVKGCQGADAELIHGAIENLGASLSPRADRDSCGMYLSGLPRYLSDAVTWLGRLACDPSFTEEELNQERRLSLEQLQAMADDPFQQGALTMRLALYGHHPYGYSVLGREASLPNLDRDDLLGWYRRTWVPNNLYVVASGDLDAADLLTHLEGALAGLPEGEAPGPPDLEPLLPLQSVLRERVTQEYHQSVVFAAWPGPPDAVTDRAELMLLKELLNGQSGRLFEALRNRRSLCYNTGIQSTAGFGKGLIGAYVLTEPESEDKALTVLLKELQMMAESPVADDELQRARAKLTGNLLISSQANSARVARCARNVLYGRDPDDLSEMLKSIAACTPESIRATAEHYFTPSGRVEVLVGPNHD